MTLTIPPELEQKLRAQASRAGLNPDDYARQVIEQAVAEPQPDDATLKLLAQWAEEDQTNDPDELARREAEWEEFKQAMNRTRREMEGPNARVPFP